MVKLLQYIGFIAICFVMINGVDLGGYWCNQEGCFSAKQNQDILFKVNFDSTITLINRTTTADTAKGKIQLLNGTLQYFNGITWKTLQTD